jgi:hypothetical protein
LWGEEDVALVREAGYMKRRLPPSTALTSGNRARTRCGCKRIKISGKDNALAFIDAPARRQAGVEEMNAPVVWLLSDGAPGHLSQSRGIVDALPRDPRADGDRAAEGAQQRLETAGPLLPAVDPRSGFLAVARI